MSYRIAVIDDNPVDIEYVTSLVKKWAESAGHALRAESFPSAEAFLFAYDADKAWDIRGAKGTGRIFLQVPALFSRESSIYKAHQK